jgi:hypothetical protein
MIAMLGNAFATADELAAAANTSPGDAKRLINGLVVAGILRRLGGGADAGSRQRRRATPWHPGTRPSDSSPASARSGGGDIEHIILFAGPMGSGKTTAIKSLSDIPVIATEAANSDRETADKATTTVAIDYGEIGVTDEEKIRLYGIPGQRRFDFMWRILA